MAYSQDYRQMILSKLKSGATYRELSLEFGISKTTILNWTKQPERKVRTVHTYKINLDDLTQDVKEYPDAYQRERAVRFNCTDRAISKALKRLNLTRKKKRLKHPSANDELRQAFIEQLEQYKQDNRPTIYLDESGFQANTYRPYAYASKGQRCFDTYNWQARNQTNAIGAIYNNKLFAVGLYECSVNSQVFYAWVEQILLPELSPNSVLVMDNATFHKRQDIQDLITEQGHIILWLPPYSPDLNLIEQVWSWIKRLRQDWRLECVDRLFLGLT